MNFDYDDSAWLDVEKLADVVIFNNLIILFIWTTLIDICVAWQYGHGVRRARTFLIMENQAIFAL